MRHIAVRLLACVHHLNEVANGEVAIHAEQKPMAAIEAARITPEDLTGGKFLVRGSKRPCLARGALLRQVSDTVFDGEPGVNGGAGAYYKGPLRAVEAYALGRPWEHPDAMETDHEPGDAAWHARILGELTSSQGRVTVMDGKETRAFETDSSDYDSDHLPYLPQRDLDGDYVGIEKAPAAATAKKRTTATRCNAEQWQRLFARNAAGLALRLRS
ncbi:hypothetical protein ACF073_07510 [Streptomyces sp. NPDC015171]|uniref:hypothetical protein n=1 Tax=Streptomyces sp. NPDC015171 TaxID=3364945 RepID=UPI0036F5BA52